MDSICRHHCHLTAIHPLVSLPSLLPPLAQTLNPFPQVAPIRLSAQDEKYQMTLDSTSPCVHIPSLPHQQMHQALPRTGVIRAGLWSASLGLAFNPNDHASRYSVWFPPDSNPRLGFLALSGISGWSAGVWVSMGVGHVMAYAAIGLR